MTAEEMENQYRNVINQAARVHQAEAGNGIGTVSHCNFSRMVRTVSLRMASRRSAA